MANLAPLTYGIVKGRYVDLVGDLTDPDAEPDVIPLKGTVTFRLSAEELKVTTATPAPASVHASEVVATLDSQGYLSRNDLRTVALQATNDPATNPTNLQWSVSFDLWTQDDRWVERQPFSFALPAGATVDLIQVAPLLTPAPNTIIIKGDKGDPGQNGTNGTNGTNGKDGSNVIPADTAVEGYLKDASSKTYAAALALAQAAAAPGDMQQKAYTDSQIAANQPRFGEKFSGVSPNLIIPVGQGELSIRPEYFGAVGDNAADDTAAVLAMFIYASAARPIPRRWQCVLVGNYKITDTLRWDVYTTSVCGPGQLLPTMDGTKYTVRTYSTDPGAEGSPVRQRAVYWDGVIIYGNGFANGIDVTGASFGDKVAHITFRNMTVTRCGIAMHYGRNAYMVSHFACNISLSRVGVWHEDTPNSGERIEYFGCDITGHGVAIKVTSGQAMHFISCSFSYVLRRIAEVTSGQVFIFGSHLEFNAPYAAFFNVTQGGGYVLVTGSRWLIRDPSPSVASAVTFPSGTNVATWADNPRDRWGEGDPVTITGLSGTTNLSSSTTYYMRNVTNTSFQLSTTPTGAIFSWTGSGSATGFLAIANAPIFYLGDASATNATVRDGHVHGSASGIKTWCEGPGAARFEIEGTNTFGSSPLRMRTRPGGEGRDGLLATGTILDDVELVGGSQVSMSVSNDVSPNTSSVNSFLITRVSAGTGARVDFWYALPSMPRILWTHDYKASAGMTINQSAYLSLVRRAATAITPALGGTLWSSNLGFTTSWQSYVQGGQNDRRAPRWAKYLLVRYDLSNLPVGQTLQIDAPEPSFM